MTAATAAMDNNVPSTESRPTASFCRERSARLRRKEPPNRSRLSIPCSTRSSKWMPHDQVVGDVVQVRGHVAEVHQQHRAAHREKHRSNGDRHAEHANAKPREDSRGSDNNAQQGEGRHPFAKRTGFRRIQSRGRLYQGRGGVSSRRTTSYATPEVSPPAGTVQREGVRPRVQHRGVKLQVLLDPGPLHAIAIDGRVIDEAVDRACVLAVHLDRECASSDAGERDAKNAACARDGSSCPW